MRARFLAAIGATALACGQPPADGESSGSSGAGSSSGSAGTSAGTSTGDGAPTSGSGTTTTGGGETSSGETSTTGGTTGGTTTGGTTEAGESSSGEASTGDTDGVCEPDAVLDAVSYNYVKTVDVGLEGVTAGFYNPIDQEVVFLAGSGSGVRLALDGTLLGMVEAPAAIAGDIDGAAYDAATHTALLIDQDCNLAEVEPATLAEIDVQAIDALKFDLGLCSAIALGLDGNLYVANVAGDEVVVISRDLETEVDRFDVQVKGINTIDGIALIPGSENFLVHSSTPPMAAILTATGEVVAPASDIGGPNAPLVGGVMPPGPDGLFTICTNGQVWLCGGLQTADCYRYAPEGGSDDLCGCLP